MNLGQKENIIIMNLYTSKGGKRPETRLWYAMKPSSTVKQKRCGVHHVSTPKLPALASLLHSLTHSKVVQNLSPSSLSEVQDPHFLSVKKPNRQTLIVSFELNFLQLPRSMVSIRILQGFGSDILGSMLFLSRTIFVLLSIWGFYTCCHARIFTFTMHHRFSEPVKKWSETSAGKLSPVDRWPEKGSFEYYAELADRDRFFRGRKLSNLDDAPLAFSDGNSTFQISSLGLYDSFICQCCSLLLRLFFFQLQFAYAFRNDEA